MATWEDSLTGPQRDVAVAVRALFASYGLSSLANRIIELSRDYDDPATITTLLQETDEYRQRFAGNIGRQQPLSPAEYLRLEQDYKSAMSAFMLPPDFYDSPEDFAKLIANDISPDELAYRAQKAWEFTQSADAETKAALAEYYGVSMDNDIVAYFLDPEKGQALIQKRERATVIGAAAKRNQLSVDRDMAERLQAMGVDPQRVQSQFAEIGAVKQEMDSAARRFDVDYGDEDQIMDATVGLASAARKRRKLEQSEKALFEERGTTRATTTSQDRDGTTMDRRGSF